MKSEREPAVFLPDDLRIGLSATFSRQITQDDIDSFAKVSGDYNPLHVDSEYSAGTKMKGTIVHGAFQIGLASALIGMDLPGRDVLLGGVSAKFIKPLPVESEVIVRGEISAWNLANRSGQLHVRILEKASANPVSDIKLAFTLRQDSDAIVTNNNDRLEKESGKDDSLNSPLERKGPIVLVTGASGGLGSMVVRSLIEAGFYVVAHHNRSPLPKFLHEFQQNVESFTADLDSGAEFENRVGALMTESPLYSIVHCAWPGMPRGGILHSDGETLTSQINAGSIQPIRLAKILYEHVDSSVGGRFVLLGSTAGLRDPNISVGAYSLGKGILESTSRLLAPELAHRKITVNAVCPSMVSVGMNGQVESRALKREASSIPLGRLCKEEDICNLVKFLLGNETGFLSGETISLTGGRL